MGEIEGILAKARHHRKEESRGEMGLARFPLENRTRIRVVATAPFFSNPAGTNSCGVAERGGGSRRAFSSMPSVRRSPMEKRKKTPTSERSRFSSVGVPFAGKGSPSLMHRHHGGGTIFRPSIPVQKMESVARLRADRPRFLKSSRDPRLRRSRGGDHIPDNPSARDI